MVCWEDPTCLELDPISWMFESSMAISSVIFRISAKAKVYRIRSSDPHSAMHPFSSFPLLSSSPPWMGLLGSTGDLVVAMVWDDLGIELDGVWCIVWLDSAAGADGSGLPPGPKGWKWASCCCWIGVVLSRPPPSTCWLPPLLASQVWSWVSTWLLPPEPKYPTDIPQPPCNRGIADFLPLTAWQDHLLQLELGQEEYSLRLGEE